MVSEHRAQGTGLRAQSAVERHSVLDEGRSARASMVLESAVGSLQSANKANLLIMLLLPV